MFKHPPSSEITFESSLLHFHNHTDTWHLAPGTWHLAPGTWHLASGTWHHSITFPPPILILNWWDLVCHGSFICEFEEIPTPGLDFFLREDQVSQILFQSIQLPFGVFEVAFAFVFFHGFGTTLPQNVRMYFYFGGMFSQLESSLSGQRVIFWPYLVPRSRNFSTRGTIYWVIEDDDSRLCWPQNMFFLHLSLDAEELVFSELTYVYNENISPACDLWVTIRLYHEIAIDEDK